jgi:hypothetical protein
MNHLELMRPSPDADARMCKITPARRTSERNAIEQQIEAFLKAGKKITTLAPGLTAHTALSKNKKKAA